MGIALILAIAFGAPPVAAAQPSPVDVVERRPVAAELPSCEDLDDEDDDEHEPGVDCDD